MKVVIDIDIPFINGVLEPYATVVYKKGGEISREDIIDADALVIRTRTKCTQTLLEGSKVRFIASATIGSDHVDLDYCMANGIIFTNAAGCNALGVVQYILTAMYTIAHLKHITLEGMTVGVVGAGNVGERLSHTLELLGFKVMRCDPPVKQKLVDGYKPFPGRFVLQRENLRPDDYYELDEVIKASDIISLHLPLDRTTMGLFDQRCFSLIKRGAIFINASRGEVINEDALLSAIPSLSAVVLDVWAGEPDINRELQDNTDIGTPHIAGYSLEGKINATVMSVNSLGAFFGIESLREFDIEYPPVEPSSLMESISEDKQEWLFKLLYEYFPIYDLDILLRKDPKSFEALRGDYEYRRELSEDMYMSISKKIKSL